MEELEQRLLMSAAIPNGTVTQPVLPTAPTPLQGVVSTPTSMGPQLFSATYGFNQIYFQNGTSTIKGDGAGQTIAIVDAYGSPTIASDVKTFDSFWGLSNNDSAGQFFLTVQPLAPTANTIVGDARDQAGWAEETALDVEYAHTVAPRAHILLIESPSDQFLDLLDANVFAGQQNGVVVVSNSWGGPDNSPDLKGDPAIFDGFFVTPLGHLDSDGLTGGVAYFASSGDDGPQLNYPAASENVIGVGGTTTGTDLNGSLLSTGVWPGSGGAKDTNLAPNYNTPLVALDADPLTGVWVYSTGVNGPGWQVVGGTSLACPAWAAYTAIIDQGLAIEGQPSLSSQTEYDALNTPQYGQSFQAAVMYANEASPGGSLLQPSTGRVLALFDTIWDGNPPDINAYPLWPHDRGPIAATPTTAPDIQTGWGTPIAINLADYFLGGGWSGLTTSNPLTFDVSTINSNLATNAVGSDILKFVQQPSNEPAGSILPSFQIEVLNSATGAVDTTFNGTIAVSLGTNSGATLNGTLSQNAVAGLATFSGLSINQEGDFTMFATTPGSANVIPMTSNDFVIGPTAGTSLAVSEEPAAAWQFGTIPPIRVSVLDQFGNVDVLDNSNVGISVESGPPGAIITGNLLESTVQGVATFADLSLNIPGTYTLKFTDGALTAAVTANFAIVPIPVTQRFTFNGAALSVPSILQQQKRNAIVFTIAGPPSKAQVAQIEAQFAQQVASQASSSGIGSDFVAQTAPVPAATFSSGPSIASDTSSVLDGGSSSSDSDLLN